MGRQKYNSTINGATFGLYSEAWWQCHNKERSTRMCQSRTNQIDSKRSKCLPKNKQKISGCAWCRVGINCINLFRNNCHMNVSLFQLFIHCL